MEEHPQFGGGGRGSTGNSLYQNDLGPVHLLG